jgi:hypothetical protein
MVAAGFRRGRDFSSQNNGWLKGRGPKQGHGQQKCQK